MGKGPELKPGPDVDPPLIATDHAFLEYRSLSPRDADGYLVCHGKGTLS